MSLPPFKEPDWSTLPPEAVAWAVDANGSAWFYRRTPSPGPISWLEGGCLASDMKYDITNIDWRTTLRLRPEKADHRPEIEALTESVEGLKAEERNYELERLAEEAWKALLANPHHGENSEEAIAVCAFDAAEAFIAEREKRRNQCP